MNRKPNVVFMGTPDLARTVLVALAEDPRWQVTLAVVQPDKPVGRGLVLQAPPVKVEALERGLPVLQPLKARDPAFIAQLRAAAPDLIVVAAYGQILPPDLLAIPTFGCLNVHTSLLPRWRGAAPIQWAMLEGDPETGVTLMRMDAGLDTGDILVAERTPITDTDTGQTLHDRLALLGGNLLVRSLPDWFEGKLAPRPQPLEGVTYARKLSREDGRLDWSTAPEVISRKVRALNPWPGAFTTLALEPATPFLLKIWSCQPCAGSGSPGLILEAAGDRLVVAAGSGAVCVESLQREGRKRMSAREFLASGAVRPGAVLGAPAPAPETPSSPT